MTQEEIHHGKRKELSNKEGSDLAGAKKFETFLQSAHSATNSVNHTKTFDDPQWKTECIFRGFVSLKD